jgi:hypothetical protein
MRKIWFFIPENFKLGFLIVLASLFTSETLNSQKNQHVDYREIFGDRYAEAFDYLHLNPWITSSLVRNKIDPCFGKSIIFPELIRYSNIRDRMEIQALKTLYVQYGQQYANFSVGRFQIKPAFAEKLEADMKVSPGFKEDALLKNIDTAQTPQARLERIKRLDSEEWQVQYLVWFIKIMDQKHSLITKLEPENRIQFYATAYNCGYHYPKKYIEAKMGKKYFHTGVFTYTQKYNYASISISYCLKCRSGTATP